MICAQMDSELKTLAWSTGSVYTRYADDLTISTKAAVLDPRISQKSQTTKQWEISSAIVDIVSKNSFKINSSKTRVRGRHSSLEITGVRINSGLNVNHKIYRQVRAMLNAWEKYGEQAAELDHNSKFAKKQRKNGIEPAFRNILRGKIEFIGFIRGRDDRIYVKLLQRFQKLTQGHASPIIIGPSTHETVIRQGVWLLTNKKEDIQGTAFALEGNRLITAAHVVIDGIMWASRPEFCDNQYLVEIVNINEELDIAELKIQTFLPVQFSLSQGIEINLQSDICVVGFPKYHKKDSVAFRFGKIVQERCYLSFSKDNHQDMVSVKHLIVDAAIVKGNSGGPVLDNCNRLIGVAVKGINIPGKLGDDDQLSSFIPISASDLPK
jgi:S1-C subfamily serine protease